MQKATALRTYQLVALSQKHLLTSLLLLALSVGGCKMLPPDLHKSIVMTAMPPPCEFQELGRVSAKDGQMGHSTGHIWGEQASMARVRNKIAQEALELGANAIVLKHRITSVQNARTSKNSAFKRPAERIKLVGIAVFVSDEACLNKVQSVDEDTFSEI